jgi:hypothetical protein
MCHSPILPHFFQLNDTAGEESSSSSSSLHGLGIDACSELIHQTSSSLHLRRGLPTLRLPRGLYSRICIVNLSLFILSMCCRQSVLFCCILSFIAYIPNYFLTSTFVIRSSFVIPSTRRKNFISVTCILLLSFWEVPRIHVHTLQQVWPLSYNIST